MAQQDLPGPEADLAQKKLPESALTGVLITHNFRTYAEQDKDPPAPHTPEEHQAWMQRFMQKRFSSG